MGNAGLSIREPRFLVEETKILFEALRTPGKAFGPPQREQAALQNITFFSYSHGPKICKDTKS
jgi:hypothetical protein